MVEATKIKILNNTNNNNIFWKACIKSYLVMKGLWEVMNGIDMIKPPKTLKNIEARNTWKTKAIKVVHIFLMNMDENTYQYIQGIEKMKKV